MSDRLTTRWLMILITWNDNQTSPVATVLAGSGSGGDPTADWCLRSPELAAGIR